MAISTEIRIGTCGWSYPKGDGTWKNTFYPKGVKNELEYYAGHFDTVEVNSTFYRIPAPGMVWGWVQRTPPDFRFAVKLWQKFTHPKMYEEATGEQAEVRAEDVDAFQKAIAPLVSSGKLSALLAQFPPSVKNDEEGQLLLREVLHHFKRYPLAVELRHKSWSDDPRTAELLREHDAAWVRIDEPHFEISIARDLPLTSTLAYYRFHGRNAAEWWHGNTETRCKYFYSEQELKGLAERVEKDRGMNEQVLIYFNNHFSGYAPRNAEELAHLLNVKLPEGKPLL